MLVQTVQGVVKAGFKEPEHPSRHGLPSPTLAAIELIKCIITVALLYRDASTSVWWNSSDGAQDNSRAIEAWPLFDVDEADAQEAQEAAECAGYLAPTHHRLPQPLLSDLYRALGPIASLYVLRDHLVRSLVPASAAS